MDASNQSDGESISRDLMRLLQGTLVWKWDRRFETVLAEFKVEDQERVRAALQQHLKATWDSANVGNAPEIIRTILDNLGGIRAGQLLFTSDPSPDALIFCTWWPWGDGKEISIRVGVAYPKLDDAERAKRIESFRGWFGV